MISCAKCSQNSHAMLINNATLSSHHPKSKNWPINILMAHAQDRPNRMIIKTKRTVVHACRPNQPTTVFSIYAPRMWNGMPPVTTKFMKCWEMITKYTIYIYMVFRSQPNPPNTHRIDTDKTTQRPNKKKVKKENNNTAAVARCSPSSFHDGIATLLIE